MTLISRMADKAGIFGCIVSAFGCAACFPAIASIGASLGLGFLQEYEGLFISRLSGSNSMNSAPLSMSLRVASSDTRSRVLSH